MKKVFYLLWSAAFALLYSSCASILPVTDNIIQQVGGSSQLPNFQYYVSRGISLHNTEQKMDGNVVGGQAQIVENIRKDRINIKESTPGVVIGYIYSDALKTNILRVAFEDDDNKYLQFAHPNNNRSGAWYSLQANENSIVYGNAVYDYSYLDSNPLLDKVGVKTKSNKYGSTPILLIKMKKQHNITKTKRTVKGRKIGK